MRFVLPALVFCLLPALAADLSPQLLSAAAAGKNPEVETLLGKGAAIEAQDKNGRTPLMLGAQHGHADTVKLLLSKGAHAEARDKSGYTAYGLAVLDPSGRGDHTAAIEALPQSRHPRISMDAVVAAGGLISSCYAPEGELKQHVTNLALDAATVKEIVDYAHASGKGLIEIAQVEKPSDADAQVTVEVQPGAACEAQAGDNLNLNIDIRVYRAKDHQLVQEKHFAGGFKGLRKQTVDNLAQYAPVYQAWIRPQAGPMYWFIVEALYRSIAG
ncbi:MAG TPA: ankyrin repeat domain-containing protein [Candidatus Sulfopaludibacter sp.]|jgi:hypothetical protein|nr:ankyrin repeat domain-containing protein [Candidatus Sulfopaludibacter sp.]